MGGGLTVGLSALAAGLCIGIVGDAGVRANAQQPRLFVGMILILIFAEALALYGKSHELSVSLVCELFDSRPSTSFELSLASGLIIGLLLAVLKADGLCKSYKL